MTAWSTKFTRANGEMTSSGSRGPYPQRSSYAPALAVPHWPVEWGGLNKKTVVWRIEASDLGPELIAQEDTVPGRRRHISIGPTATMSFADLVKAVVAKVKNEGLLNTFASVRDKMAASQALGYSAAGIVSAVAEDVTEFQIGDRVACAGVGFASHAEVLSVPKNLCVHLPESVSFESGAYGTLGAIALQGVRLAEPTLGESVVVIGSMCPGF